MDFTQEYEEGCRLFRAGDLDAAVAAFGRAAALKPDDFRPHEMAACCHGNSGRWAEALAAFERAGALGHECASCWYNRALALRVLRRRAEALAALDRAITLEPNHIAAWYDRATIEGLGVALAEGESEPFDGRHERAVEAFDRVLALKPDAPAAWYGKAHTLFKLMHAGQARQGLLGVAGRADLPRRALACAERAISLGPGRPEAIRLRDEIMEWIDGAC